MTTTTTTIRRRKKEEVARDDDVFGDDGKFVERFFGKLKKKLKKKCQQ